MAAKPDPLQQAIVSLMESITDSKEWTERRIGLFDHNDNFVAILPSNSHYGAVAALCKKYNLSHRMVDVKVSYVEEME